MLIVLDRGEMVQSVKVLTALVDHIPNLTTYYAPTQVKDTGDLPFKSIPKVAEFLIGYTGDSDVKVV